jgi:hypothetical protein
VFLVVLVALVTAWSPAFAQSEPAPARDRGPLVPLYVSYATLQALDIHSTLRALNGGAVEGNPMMNGVVSHPVPFMMVKAGAAAATIVLAERVRKRSRVGAIVVMAAVNSAYAMVVAHNYRAVR